MMGAFALLKSGVRYGAAVVVLIVGGCYPMLETVGVQPDGAQKYGSGEKPIDPAVYRVRSGAYPQYRVESARRPPGSALMVDGTLRTSSRPGGEVLASDVWEVRYKFHDFLMVNSLDFDRRFCGRVTRPSNLPMMDDGRCGYDWCLYISIRGEVTGGWDTCPIEGSGRFVFKPDPDVVSLQDWGPQPFFEVVKRQGSWR